MKDDPWHIRSQLPAGAMDDKFSVFHRPTRHMIGIDLTQGGTQVSMFFRDRQSIVNLTLKDKFRRRPHSGDESDDSVPSMQSVQELMWKELRPLRIAEIPDLYMRLAKVRLTGELCRFSFLNYCYFWFFKPEMKWLWICISLFNEVFGRWAFCILPPPPISTSCCVPTKPTEKCTV